MSDLSSYVEHLYRIPRERMGECAALAARAFLGNPINDYLFDDLPKQGLTMQRFYETSLKAAFDTSEFYAPDEGLDAMIVVTPPGTGRKGTPLVYFKSTFGSPGYLVPYALFVIAVICCVYLVCYVIRHMEERHCENLKAS